MATLTPVPGITRLRAFQLGLETTPFTQHAADRRLPWSFAPTVDPHWTDVVADTGTLDNAIAPYRTAIDVTGQSTGQVFANDLPFLLSGAVMGGISATTSGTAKTWTYAPATTSQDVFDTFTGEWYDDATADAWAGTGGVIETLTLDYPQDLGPITHTADWRFGAAVYPATPTGALNVDLSPVPLFAADTVVSINDTSGAIGTTPFTNQVYDIQIQLTNNLDVKRFINGSNTRFQAQNYGRGARMVQVTITFAKATAAIAEAAKWLGTSPTERYIQINTPSLVAASAGIQYAFNFRMGGFWYTRAEQTINANTGFQLVGHNVYDSGLGYPFRMQAVTTLSSL